MDCDSDALAGAKPAGVTLAPVGAGRAIVEKVRVDVDEHPALPLLLLHNALQAAKSGVLLIVNRYLEIGLLRQLFLYGPVLIIDIVEIVDGWLPR